MVRKKLFEFQGVLLSKYQGIDSNIKMQETAYSTAAESIYQSCKDVVLSVSEFSRDFNIRHSMAHELHTWLDSKNMGHVMPILAHHGISSMMMLSSLNLSNDVISLIAEELSAASSQSQIQSLSNVTLLILKAKESELSKAPSWRCDRFLDYDASAMTAIFSSCAVDIMLSKKYFVLFVLLIGGVLCFLCIFAWISHTYYLESWFTPNFFANPLELMICAGACSVVGVWPLVLGGNYDQIPKNQLFKPRHIFSYCFAAVFLVQSIVFMLSKSIPFESFSLFNSLQCSSADKKGWLQITLETCVIYELVAIYLLQYLGFALWFVSLNFYQKHFVQVFVVVLCCMCIVDSIFWNYLTTAQTAEEDAFASILLQNIPAIITVSSLCVLATFEGMRFYSSQQARKVR